VISVSLTLPLTIVVVHAQGVDSSGDIRGTVTDTSGAVMPKVTVIVVHTQTGPRRTTLTQHKPVSISGLIPGHI
jgi:hypothetical protein